MSKFLPELASDTNGAVVDWLVLSAGVFTLVLFVLYELYSAI